MACSTRPSCPPGRSEEKDLPTEPVRRRRKGTKTTWTWPPLAGPVQVVDLEVGDRRVGNTRLPEDFLDRLPEA